MYDNPGGVVCFIGIGSNMSNPIERCEEAIELIDSIKGIKVLRRSSLYRSEPVGFLEQDWFVNAVIEIKTLLPTEELLKALRKVESNMGRKKSQKWRPRVIDLDILLYSQDVIEEETLVVPHPELHKRRFVLLPLYEIASYVIHPVFGISIRGLLDRLEDSSKVELI